MGSLNELGGLKTADLLVCVLLPVRIQSETNLRGHWMKKARRVKKHRSVACTMMKNASKSPPKPPCVITLTRIAPRTLDDDNLSGGFKAVRDGVADWLRIDDGDKRLTWKYDQRKGRPKEYAAEVVVSGLIGW